MKGFWMFAVLLVTILAVSAFPASENDRNDISSNLVTTAAAIEAEKERKNTVQPQVSVSVGGQIGISVPGETTTGVPEYQQPTEQPKNVLTRFIDDIFQIPITVLQSVSKLLTNPFTQQQVDKGKDVASA